LFQNCFGSRIQTWNRYAYVNNNPLAATDPLGLLEMPDCPIGCGGGGGYDPSIGTPGDDAGGFGYGGRAPVDAPLNMGQGSAGAINRCGVDPFCIAKGGVTAFETPEAQVHCDPDGYCMVGSEVFSQYNVGGTYTVDWPAQKQAEINSAVNAFLKQEAALAAVLNVTIEQLRGIYLNPDGSLKDPNDTNHNPFLQGGNWNFYTYENFGCDHDRCGSIPSLHFHDTGFVHLDTANPFWGYGLGAMVHFGVDVFLGNTFLASGIPR
jgi:hypothetical protein